MKYELINSRLYKLLFDNGGDKLIAVYCICKNSRNSKQRIYPEKTSQNKTLKFYRLLHYKTKLSEATLKKYIPKLIDLGVCNFSKDGGFYFYGSNKLNLRFKKKRFIKIAISNFTETCLNSYLVRLKSLEKTQIKKIYQHQRQINIISRAERGFFIKKSEKTTLKRLNKKRITISELKLHCDKVVLSNKGFAFLKDSEQNNISKGFYWKSKLKKNNLIKTNRRFEFICEASYINYLFLKRNSNNRKLVFKNNKVYVELISSFNTIV